MSFLVVMTNTASLNVAKKQKYHANAAIIGTPCPRGRSRENASEKLGNLDAALADYKQASGMSPEYQEAQEAKARLEKK